MINGFAFFVIKGIARKQKDTRPIDVQVAELSEEQKDTIVTIYKKRLLPATILCWIVVLILGPIVASQIFFVMRVNVLYDEYMDALDTYSSTLTLSGVTYSISDQSHPKVVEAKEKYDAADTVADTLNILMLCGAPVYLGVGIFGILNLTSIKKQYPYFSEKKYSYIAKARKNG